MEVIWGFDNTPQLNYGIATVGSYDGVHRGHKILLDEVISRARECGGESVVLTFEPHPRITLGQAEGLYLLTSFDEKRALLEQLGVDYMVIIPFDKRFSQLSHEEFVNDYLVGRLNIKELVVGYNHRFGCNNEGDYNYLSQHRSLQVVEVPQYRFEGEKVSSTVIRKVLDTGNTSAAAQLLGHPYIIIGIADEKGQIEVDEHKLLPSNGRYGATIDGVATDIEICNRRVLQGVKFSQKVKIELL